MRTDRAASGYTFAAYARWKQARNSHGTGVPLKRVETMRLAIMDHMTTEDFMADARRMISTLSSLLDNPNLGEEQRKKRTRELACWKRRRVWLERMLQSKSKR